jgi:tight adherence protein B
LTASIVLAAAAAVTGVLAAWNALGMAERPLLRLLAAIGPDGAVSRMLAPVFAGRALSRAERRRTVLVAGAGLLMAGTVVAGPLAGLALAAAAPLLARQSLVAADRRRRARLSAGAPAVARAVADALAGGHSIRGAFAVAAREGSVTGPAGQELRALAAALALGRPRSRCLSVCARARRIRRSTRWSPPYCSSATRAATSRPCCARWR